MNEENVIQLPSVKLDTADRSDDIDSISGVEFDTAWANRLVVDVDGLQVPFIGRDDLLANKRATGRPKDLLDVEYLTRE